MNQKSFSKLLRYAELADQIIDAKDVKLKPVVKAIAPLVKAATASYQAACTNARNAESAANKEVEEITRKLESFGRTYDSVRGLITATAPHETIGPAASQFTTQIDLIKSAETIEQVLTTHAQEPWASEVGPAFAAELESIKKEWTEALESQNQEQKVKAARKQAADEFFAVLVDFRKVVKAVYGSNSREYHFIKPGNKNGETENEGADIKDATTDKTPALELDAKKTDKAA
jgi:hypothetical protein